LDVANQALRSAVGCRPSTLKSHSSSSSVIFASAGPTRPRSRHDPVKAFQNHVCLFICLCMAWFSDEHPLSFVRLRRRQSGRPLLILGSPMPAQLLCSALQSFSLSSRCCQFPIATRALISHQDPAQLCPAGQPPSSSFVHSCESAPLTLFQLRPTPQPSSRPGDLGNSSCDGTAPSMVRNCRHAAPVNTLIFRLRLDVVTSCFIRGLLLRF
jgi:hypothetical protein